MGQLCIRFFNRGFNPPIVHQKGKEVMKIMRSKRNWMIALLLVSNVLMAFKLNSGKRNDENQGSPAVINQDTTLVIGTPLVNKDSSTIQEELVSIPTPTEHHAKISSYDDIIRKYAATIDWDWRLIAAIIHKESKFNPKAHSPGGMVGLMQLVPSTGYKFGLTKGKEYDPETNIKAGVNYIKALDKIWARIENKEERQKFIIASYNSGEGHVLDAYRLAQKLGKNTNVWTDNVEFGLSCKAQPIYYKDPVVKCGYFNGPRTVEYVKVVYAKYEAYKQLGA